MQNCNNHCNKKNIFYEYPLLTGEHPLWVCEKIYLSISQYSKHRWQKCQWVTKSFSVFFRYI